MQLKDWQYVAPQRIRTGVLALPKAQSWPEIQSINYQRFARILEFQGCIAFVGSGSSLALGYPKWNDLLPPSDHSEIPDLNKRAYRELIGVVAKSEIDPPQALEIAENLLGDESKSEGRQESGRGVILRHLRRRFDEAREKAVKTARHQASPLEALLTLPIRRFITTNYDLELEEALQKLHSDLSYERGNSSFSQDDLDKLAIFAVALARGNRNMVFHCHGALRDESPGPASTNERSSSGRRGEGDSNESLSSGRNSLSAKKHHSTVILTDADYKYWYLSNDRVPYTFQRGFEVLLQSNPLFFVGYSLTDADLVRILRHLSIRRAPTGLASNVFALVNAGGNASESWRRAQQIKSGINLIPYNEGSPLLATELENQKRRYEETRAAWRKQACAKTPSLTCAGAIEPRPTIESYGPKRREAKQDPLFDSRLLLRDDDPVIQAIATALNESRVVALTGPAGAGKFLKACQFVRSEESNAFLPLVFNSYHNDDIYSYLKRIADAVQVKAELKPPPDCFCSLEDRLKEILNIDYRSKLKKPLLLVISGVDLFLDFDAAQKQEPESGWQPRNKAAATLIKVLSGWRAEHNTGNRVLLTGRSLPARLRQNAKCIDLLDRMRAASMFSAKQLDLTGDEYKRLSWQLQDEQSGLVIGSAYVADFDELPGKQPSASGDSREKRLEQLMHVLSSSVSERGTRVVRHVIRSLDRGTGKKGYEDLLAYLSCFNTPVVERVVEECIGLVRNTYSESVRLDFRVLVQLRLLESIRSEGAEASRSADGGNRAYIVPSIVKRYCRTILSGSHYPERRACGVHGLLSRGPFNDPGTSKKPRTLFNHFATLAFKRIRALLESADYQAALNECRRLGRPAENSAEARLFEKAFGKIEEKWREARWFTRATLDILRTNFACNSVPSWGTLREYIDMCSFCLDLVKNLACALGDTWHPGEGDPRELSDFGIASAEEMISLYNELGLAYYNDGSVQDALSIWGVALAWQKAVALRDYDQGVMYSASLYSHLDMGYLQMGRMDTARESIEKARLAARAVGNEDLEVRLQGVLARIDHFRGNLKQARNVYRQVVRRLGEIGNRRAQSYFMRHLASLLIRLREYDQAERLGRLSLAIAASENSSDLVAFSRELLAKIVTSKGGNPREAIREYQTALDQARDLGITRLQADVLLGLAKVQLSLGDAGAARNRAIEALKLANENLLVLRQIKALMILGQAVAERGDIKLGACYLAHAKSLAYDSQFRLAEHDADKALAELQAPS